MNVLVLGGGGREHAMAWKLNRSPQLEKLYVAPGNAGTGEIAENVPLNANDFEQIKTFVLENNIGLVIVGPEMPLVDGIADFFKKDEELKNTHLLGPTKQAAKMEGSKDFAKKFMSQYQIPTASSRSFQKDQLEEGIQFLNKLNPPYVLKADGLAAGKGVLILYDLQEAEKALKEMLVEEKFGSASQKVVIEEFLDGVECSVFALVDGENYVILPVAKDYKRIGEGDTGLNTGGMGCISPVPFADDNFMLRVEEKIVKPTLKGLKNEGLDYKGFLFFGLMNVDGHPYVVEYNVRMGDPEAQVVLPRVDVDFLQLCAEAARGKLETKQIKVKKEHALSVIAASGGYPGKYEKNKEIKGVDKIKDALVFHAGTRAGDNKIFSSGGRVLALTAMGDDMKIARAKAYENMKQINFEKMYYRKDIGLDVFA